ncbi:MAG TPA: HD domain-containing protein [Candidatus Acidoferrum sp.]|nr:HD domain-containing protein [Candidatus Acidoferrum sp.]
MIPLKFLDDVISLKRVPRSGWITYRIGKHDLEPVSSHTYSVAVIALMMSETMRLKKQKVNVEQVLKMALLHDLSESLTFDISKAFLRYLGRKGSLMKARLEEKAISRILADLQNDRLAHTLRTAINEYSSSNSLEARIVHSADALDLLLQVIEYERMGYSSATLDPIWRQTRSKLTKYRLPLAIEWSRQLQRARTGLLSRRAQAR